MSEIMDSKPPEIGHFHGTCDEAKLLLWETWPGASVHSSVVEVGLADRLPHRFWNPQQIAKWAGARKLVTYLSLYTCIGYVHNKNSNIHYCYYCYYYYYYNYYYIYIYIHLPNYVHLHSVEGGW